MLKIFLFTASSRKESCNRKLALIASLILQEKNHTVSCSNLSECNLPLYDGDLETTKGIPERALAFSKTLEKSDGVILASPEYNYSTPGTLKNLIDWISRIKPTPLIKKPILLLSASPSLSGGSRGLLHTASVLLCCGAYVFPKTFSLPNAYEAFNSQGRLINEKSYTELKKCLYDYVEFIFLIRNQNKLL